MVNKSNTVYYIYKCPQCGNETSRDLECTEHGKNCPLIVCTKCGATVATMCTK